MLTMFHLEVVIMGQTCGTDEADELDESSHWGSVDPHTFGLMLVVPCCSILYTLW